MRILQVHNKYQLKGGEETVLELERELLENNNHEVFDYIVSNDLINSFYDKMIVFLNICYSNYQKNKISAYIKEIAPDVVHVHNFFPMITPAVFDACIENNTPVIMTLHNYRLICPSGLLFHNNMIYEKAIDKGVFSTIIDKVYRNSYLATFSVARMIAYHKRKKTWHKKVDRMIALTDFAKSKFMESGFITNNFSIKPNFVDDFNFNLDKEDYFVFVGRLSQEKGVGVLLDAFSINKKSLKIIGDGPMREYVSDFCNKHDNISYLGFQKKDIIIEQLKKAKALIFTSLWYEGMPMTILESLSVGTPVIAPNIGAPSSIINHGENGLIYNVSDVEDLNRQVDLLSLEENKQKELSDGARLSYELNYTPEINYNILMGIYNNVINEKK